MKLDFKRIMSSVLAFVMLFSSLVMVNVVSVSAAETTKDWMGSTEAPDWVKLSNFTPNSALSDSNAKASFADTIFGSTGAIKGQKGCLSGGNTATFTVTVDSIPEGGKAKMLMYALRSGGTTSVSCTSTNKNNVSFDSNQIGNTKDTDGPIAATTVTFTASGDYTFKFNSGGIYIYKLSLIIDDGKGGSGTTATWEVNKEQAPKLSGTLTATGVDGKDYAVLSYDGSDYSLLPSKRVITTSTNGVTANGNNKWLFTITDEMVDEYFIQPANIPYSAIKITNGGNRVLHLACQKHNNDVISVKMNNDGTAVLGTIYSDTGNGGYGIDTEDTVLPLHKGTYTATMTGGTLKESAEGAEKNTFVVTDSVSKFEAEFVADELKNVDTTTTNEIKFNSIKVADAAAAERLMGGTVIGGGYFRVLGADYSDEGVYALRKTPGGKMPEGSENDKAFAIVLRCNDATDEGNDYGSAIGFKIAGTDDTTNKEFTLKLQCQAVKDIQSDGENATIGLMKINEDNDAKISDIGVYTPITSTNVENVETYEEVTFSGLKPNTAYGIYNPGLSDANGNIRIYSAVFSSSDAPEDTGSEIKEALKPNELDNASFSGISEDGATAIMGGSNGKKFVVCGDATLNNFTKKIENGKLPDEAPYDITKAIKFGGASSGTNRYIQFTTSGSESDTGKLYVYGLTSSNNTRPVNLKEGSNVTAGDSALANQNSAYVDKKEFNIKGGKTYTLYVGGGGCNIAYVGSTLDLEDNVVTTYPVTLSGTNNTGNTVTVNVMKGDKKAGTAEIANGVFTKVNVTPELEADTYTLSADGYKFTPATIEVSESKKDFTDIIIDESTELNITFSVGETKPNSTIYIYKGDDRTSPTQLTNANDSKTVTAEPNDTFIIAGKYDSAKSTYGSLPDNVYKWEPANAKDSKASILFHNGKEADHNERYFIYTVPSTAKPADGEYGVKFTAISDITTLSEDKNISGDLASTITGLSKTIGLGTYGFGEDKATLYGNDARKIVAYSFQTASADDYTSAGAGGTKYNDMDPAGYTTKGTEYGILNADKTSSQYFIFKTGDWTNYASPETNECTAVIESSVNGIKVEKLTADGTSDSSTQADQSFKTTGQHKVTLKPNSIYRVTAEFKDGHKSNESTLSYVKSIRITDPNNIFDSPVFERLDENEAVVAQKGNAVEQQVKDLLTSSGESIEDTDTVFRIISEISLQGDNNGTEQVAYALSQIKAVGYDVYEKDTYDKLNDLKKSYDGGNYYNEGASEGIKGHLEDKGLSDTDLKPKDVIIFGDVVNTAVDTKNTTKPDEPTADIGTIGDTSKLFVQTYYKIAAGGAAKALIPWVSYDYAGGSSSYTKIYTVSSQTGGKDPARILDPAAE